MILVIADDLTGAAELAGIGWRYGLQTVVCTGSTAIPESELVIIDTGTRSLQREEAKSVTRQIAEQVKELRPSWVYKKIDSVLRGHVMDEVGITLEILGKEKAIIGAANPSLGRTIRNGQYLVNGIPVHATGFANDPEFPINSSFIHEMLGIDAAAIAVIDHLQSMPGPTVIVAAVEQEADTWAWAHKTDDQFLLTGAGDFFTALLERKYKKTNGVQPGQAAPQLYISGTAFKERQEFIEAIHNRNHNVAFLTRQMLQTRDAADKEWLTTAGRIKADQDRLVIAVREENKQVAGIDAAALRTVMAEAANQVIEEEAIREIFVEGGSTAAALLSEMGVQQLVPVQELQRGVVRMQAGDYFITVKPGSYPLPDFLVSAYA